ncbi:MAG TPA: hypothetical protein VEX67_17990 [Solirubrobacteraceae bacterium]|nr:hypothetical protein [Solirubrobacteraceae bacterium]
MSTLAQGGTGSPPAGGGELGQVVGGTVGAMIVTAVMFYLVLGHRSGRVKVLQRLGLYSERVAGLPPWAALPLGVLSGSLITAVFGMYWDISTHLDAGRDPGPFANASHYFILVGLFGVFFAGLLAIFLPTETPGASALKLPGGLEAPLGGVLILFCSGVALAGFQLDDLWHRIFGQDVTLWGPTHLLLFGGASLSTLGGMILLMEGAAVSRDVRPERATRNLRVMQVLLGGAFLIGLSTFQGEFDFAVPQFRLVFHPILLMLASSVALVAVRIWAGPGAALGAAGFFILVRGILTLLVSPLFGHTTLHFPLYLAEAAVVELVALRVARDKPLTLGLLTGLGIGTVGLAAEWAWSHAWWTIEWPASMLVEGVACGVVAAVAGGVTGAFVGRALSSPEIAPQPVPRFALPAALAALVAVVAYATPVTGGDPVRAQVTLTDAKPPPQREVNVRVALDPADAAHDASWFVTTAWQGKEGRSPVAPLEEVSPGVYRSTEPVPVYGDWKSTLRLHKGFAIQGLALYFPEDKAIPVKGVPAEPAFTRSFKRDKELLQREQKSGVSGVLVLGAYLIVLLIFIGLYGSMGWGLALMQQRLAARAVRA